MSERVYQQVEDAIARRLYCVRGSRSSGGLAYWTPIGIDLGEIVMLWGDCGNPNDPDDLWRWTPEEWTQFAGEDGQYLYEKTGMWSFSPANDPANDLIRRCHQSPNAAGMLMHEWRTEIATLRAELSARDAEIAIFREQLREANCRAFDAETQMEEQAAAHRTELTRVTKEHERLLEDAKHLYYGKGWVDGRDAEIDKLRALARDVKVWLTSPIPEDGDFTEPRTVEEIEQSFRILFDEAQKISHAHNELRAQLARVTKQRDEAWRLVELAYQEAIGECEDYADELLWEQSASKAALDAARAEVSKKEGV